MVQRRKAMGGRRDTGKPCISHFHFRWVAGHYQCSGDLQIVGEICINFQGAFKLCWLCFPNSFQHSPGQKLPSKGSCHLSADFEVLGALLFSPFVISHACCSRNIIHVFLSESGLRWIQGGFVSGAMSLYLLSQLGTLLSFTSWPPSLFKMALLRYNWYTKTGIDLMNAIWRGLSGPYTCPWLGAGFFVLHFLSALGHCFVVFFFPVWEAELLTLTSSTSFFPFSFLAWVLSIFCCTLVSLIHCCSRPDCSSSWKQSHVGIFKWTASQPNALSSPSTCDDNFQWRRAWGFQENDAHRFIQ